MLQAETRDRTHFVFMEELIIGITGSKEAPRFPVRTRTVLCLPTRCALTFGKVNRPEGEREAGPMPKSTSNGREGTFLWGWGRIHLFMLVVHCRKHHAMMWEN